VKLKKGVGVSISQALSAARKLHDVGDLRRAESAYRELVDQSPGEPSVWRSLADLCRDRGGLQEAEECYRRALQIAPRDAESINGLGITLGQGGQTAEAIETFRHAISVAPDYAQVHHNLGVALVESGDLDAAITAFRDAIRIKPNYPEAFLSLGNAYAAQGDGDQAISTYRDSLQLRADSADALNGLGLALTGARRAAEATVFLRQAIRLRPEMTGAYNNLGLALADLGMYDRAEEVYEQSLRLDPQYAEAHVNLGNALKEQARLLEALACYDIALWLKPQSATARWNRSLALLQSGDFARGWLEYGSRHSRKGASGVRPFSQPAWDGSPLRGRRVLMYSEQGLGDVVHFIRYVLLLKEAGAYVIVEVPSPLARLLQTCTGVDHLVVEGQQLPEFDVHVSMMDLPRLFRTTLDSIPTGVPYVFPEPDRAARWRARLEGSDRFKVGIAWQGNPHHQWDRHRSVPLAQFGVLAAGESVQLVSLQRGPGTEQIDDVHSSFPLNELLDRSAPDDEGIADTAAIISELDLVVTVDTAVAHIAGAMGKPVWVVLSTMVDWRWMLDRDDSPWYPTMRLFRQERRGEWEPVFARVARELGICVPPASTADPVTPVDAEDAASRPEVSCLCVTRSRPDLLRRAIYCFDRQTVSPRQLVVVVEDDDLATLDLLRGFEGRDDVRPVVVRRDPKMPLGELRNIAVQNATGEYVAQWDDDDFYHPERLAAQLSEIRRTGRRACVLRRWVIYKDGRAVVSSYRHWEGSLMCRRADMPAYPPLHRGEDTPVIEQLEATGKIAALDRPELYVYAFHGGNTWHGPHWDAALGAGTGSAADFPVLHELLDYERRSA
jgi:tetratricopeptide (TPR) repeat protein